MTGLRRVLVGTILGLPAVALGCLAWVFFEGEYFQPIYLIVSAVLAASAFFWGILLVPDSGEERFWPLFLRLMVAAFLATLVALIALAALSMTPLCVGQDNGDGTNDLVLCLVQTGLVTVFFGPFVMGWLAIAAASAGLLLSRLPRGSTQSARTDDLSGS